MISYEDNRNSVSCAAPGIQATGMQLSGMMTQGDNMAQEILNMAQKINVHMFGESNSDRDEAEPPMCFQDVLANQLKTLSKATCELTAIMDKLGVQMDA